MGKRKSLLPSSLISVIRYGLDLMTPDAIRILDETEQFLGVRVAPPSSWDDLLPEGVSTQPRINKGLLDLLECPYQARQSYRSNVIFPKNIDSNRTAIQQCLPRLFLAIGKQARPRVDVTSILSGLQRAQCWQDIIRTEEGAYLLAAALIGFIDAYNPSFAMDVVVAPAVRDMLNSWLRPETDWESLPTAGVVCAHFFGHAWAQFSLPADCWTLGGGLLTRLDVVRDLVLHVRPPFLPGLCQVQIVAPGVDLPELGITS